MSLRTVVRWEVLKLVAQRRTRLALSACALGPLGAAVVLRVSSGLPKDTLFGRHIRESGYALPLLLLGFAGVWVLPVLAALVPGDIFSSEDASGTWATLLTRSVQRIEVFVGKVLTGLLASTLLLAVLAGSSIVAGLLLAGSAPLIGLGGQLIRPGAAAVLVLLSWTSTMPCVLMLASVAVLLSVLTRSSLAGIGVPVLLGFGTTLVSLLDGLGPVRGLLPTAPLTAWHGLLQPEPEMVPIWEGTLLSLGYALICLTIAGRVLVRRDVVTA